MTNLTPEQMMADVKLLRNIVSQGLFGLAPFEVNMHMIAMFTKALVATDRPEYKEEG